MGEVALAGEPNTATLASAVHRTRLYACGTDILDCAHDVLITKDTYVGSGFAPVCVYECMHLAVHGLRLWSIMMAYVRRSGAW